MESGAGQNSVLDNQTATTDEETSRQAAVSRRCCYIPSPLWSVAAINVDEALQLGNTSPLPWRSPPSFVPSGFLQGQRTKSYDIQVKHLNYKLPSPVYNSKLGKLKRFLAHQTHINPHGQEQQQQQTVNHVDAQHILRDVSFHAKAGELLAIAGPSGAGKSTLLEVLAGRIRPSSSRSVLVNDEIMDVAQFRRVSSYVMQDDALFPTLTVRETLLFSARLRLPSTMSLGLKKARVDALLLELGLEHVANSRIGSETIRGVSGGERRRVSIGVDVVHDPSVLLLDEPTSGLDSGAAMNIVAMIRSMAESRNCTVILSIHQPNFRILELMHSILLLADGKVVHHGSLEMLASRLEVTGHKIPAQVNVLEYAIDAVNAGRVENGRFSIEVDAQIMMSKDQQNSLKMLMDAEEGLTCSPSPDRGNLGIESPPRNSKEEKKVSYANSIMEETLVLANRCFKNIARSKELFVARTFQSLAAGLTLGTIFINSNKGGMEGVQERFSFFAFTMTFFLSSSTEALPIFLQERQILTRESSRGAYRIFSYMVSSSIVFAPFLLIIGLIYCIPTYYIVKLDPSPSAFFFFVLVIWLVLLEANSFVSFFAALVPNFIMGNALIMVCMGAFFLFCGYFISKDRIPKYWIFAHYLSLLKYPLEALLANEYQQRAGECFDDNQSASENRVGNQKTGCNLTGEQILRQLGVDGDKWINVAVMVAFVVFYRLIAYFVVCFQISRRRR
ncbi:unnamed protein product [Calypogeia fissa]